MSNTPVPVSEKPLNQSQLKNLREIVAHDFRDLGDRLFADIERRRQHKITEIEERYKDMADLDAARAKVVEFQRRVEDEIEQLRQELTNGSGTITAKDWILRISAAPSSLVQTGKDEEIRKIDKAAQELRQTLQVVLGREKRAIDRLCLLQGISATGAHELINDIPEPDDILPRVAAEMLSTSEDAMKVLMTDDEIQQAQQALEGDE